MMVRVIWYNQGPADPETVYANIPGAGTQTGNQSLICRRIKMRHSIKYVVMFCCKLFSRICQVLLKK